MIQYQHAIGSNGEIANIGEITREARAIQQYSCIGCGAKMTAVLGDIKAHHFRHSGDSCPWESYLHQLGKVLLKQRFDSAQEFLVRYYVRNGCPNFDACKLREDHAWQRCPPVELRTFDLKKYYDTCEVEATWKGFRADLMLTHSGYPERVPVFLEIAVSHRCEESKIDSGIRIIEMDVQSEFDVIRYIVESSNALARQESGGYAFTDVPGIRFYNFKRAYEPEYSLDRFYLFMDENGMYRARLKHNAVNCYDVANKHEEGACFEVTLSEDYRHHQQHNTLYALGVALSIKKGYQIKNCAFCSHYDYCKLIYTSKAFDKSSGKYYLYPKRVANKSIPASKLNKWVQASNCLKYHVSVPLCQKIIDSCKSLPYLEWSKDD